VVLSFILGEYEQVCGSEGELVDMVRGTSEVWRG
jgi:hypothetical protein